MAPPIYPMMEVDLDAIEANYRAMQALAGASSEVACVLKADAYGCGAKQVGRALYGAGARSFFLSSIYDCIALKGMLPQARLFQLHRLSVSELADCLANGVIPVVNRFEELEHLAGLGGALPGSVALHIDTGINRLGFRQHDLEALKRAVDAVEGVRVCLLVSHFANAEYGDVTLCDEQSEALTRAASAFPGVPMSICNSGGILLNRRYALDMTRTGVCLLGYNHNPTGAVAKPAAVRPAVEIRAKLLDVQTIQAGEAVGYGGAFRAGADMRIGLVNMGYQHGFPKQVDRARGPFHVSIGPHRAEIVGKVSMDMLTVDVSHIPADELACGTVVTVLDAENIESVALSCHTMIVDLLIKMGAACNRVFVRSSARGDDAGAPRHATPQADMSRHLFEVAR